MTRFARGVAAPVTRGIRGRGWFARLLMSLAALALLTPSLAAVQPELAGWSAAHGHIYEGGVPVGHSHPWDATPGAADESSGADTEGVTFTWDDASTVFAVAVPLAAGIAVVSTLLFALERLRPQAPRSPFAAVLTPPPR